MRRRSRTRLTRAHRAMLLKLLDEGDGIRIEFKLATRMCSRKHLTAKTRSVRAEFPIGNGQTMAGFRTEKTFYLTHRGRNVARQLARLEAYAKLRAAFPIGTEIVGVAIAGKLVAYRAGEEPAGSVVAYRGTVHRTDERGDVWLRGSVECVTCTIAI